MEHHYAETGKVNVDRPVFVWLVQPTIACYMYGSGCCGELMEKKKKRDNVEILGNIRATIAR